MKKYMVICYAVHNKEVASHDIFNTYDEAVEFLEKDSQSTYDEEYNGAVKEDKKKIDFTLDDDSAYLSSYEGEYEWTWEIVELTV